jgi:hypothetical protein
VLAYVFWHRPLDHTALEAYERAEIAFHRSLSHNRPVGLRGSAVFRVAELPWMAPPVGALHGIPHSGSPGHAGAGAPDDESADSSVDESADSLVDERAGASVDESPGSSEDEGAGVPAYEDWYLVEDYAALGVLNEAAVARGHRTVHDDLARRFGAGAGGLYGLVEGELAPGLDSIGEASIAVWVARTPGAPRRALGELLGDGMDPGRASLWRRQLVLGPAPEFCLLALEPPAGVAATRLPDGWTARTLEREALWHG